MRYEQVVWMHPVPAFGRFPLARVGLHRLHALYQDLLKRGMTPTGVHHVHAIAHRAFRQALRWRLVAANIVELVDAPPMRRRQMSVLTPGEVRRLFEAVEDHRLGALWVLAASTGLRQGELLALHWRHVDLDVAALSVVGTFSAAQKVWRSSSRRRRSFGVGS